MTNYYMQKADAFQTEIQFLTVSVSKLEVELQKRDKEIERLKKETKAVNTLQEAEKEFKTQVTPSPPLLYYFSSFLVLLFLLSLVGVIPCNSSAKKYHCR
jgi:hypothetical protein